jgi:flagellar hook-basal body complex protein FliE
MATPIAAANAYAALARITDSMRSTSAGAGNETGGQGFGSMVKEALGSIIETGQKSDAQSRALAAGKANIVDVVTAVAESEVAIESLVSVRDRVIQSYEEIMKMPI